MFSTFYISKADSGFDCSYDSGGGSDYGGSSSLDYGGNDITFEENPVGYVLSLILGIATLGFWLFIFTAIALATCSRAPESKNKKITDFSKYPGFDENIFLSQAFEVYKDVQFAWSNFDYETLRKLTTDEMYNMYKMQLETLAVKNQRNVMSDIKKIDSFITDIKDSNGTRTITVDLKVNQRDYIIDTRSNKVLRGNANKVFCIEYRLTFVTNINNNISLVCPNCGAPIINSASQKCEYCNSTLVNNYNNNWVLSKKENIGQR